jgi:O-antigen/teichoic acid export membrane protein
MALGMIVLAGDEFLRRWVGPEFISQGYPVLVVITVALMIDSLTNIPSMINDALGHPRISGRFALARGVFGVVLVYIGTKTAGIVGAAAAHLTTAIVMSFLFLAFVHGRTVPIALADALKQGMGRSIAVGALIFCILFPVKWLMPSGLLSTAVIVGVAVFVLIAAGITFIMRLDERAALFAAARRLRG